MYHYYVCFVCSVTVFCGSSKLAFCASIHCILLSLIQYVTKALWCLSLLLLSTVCSHHIHYTYSNKNSCVYWLPKIPISLHTQWGWLTFKLHFILWLQIYVTEATKDLWGWNFSTGMLAVWMLCNRNVGYVNAVQQECWLCECCATGMLAVWMLWNRNVGCVNAVWNSSLWRQH